MIEQFVYSHSFHSVGISVRRRAHVGVVASGDLEILLQPAKGDASVLVTTNVLGHEATWKAVFCRFFERWPYAVSIEINDHGATPGILWLRLEQALELANGTSEHP